MKTLLTLICLFPFAAVAAEMTAANKLGLEQYCAGMYDKQQLPAEKKDAFCGCFLTSASSLKPATQEAIILIGKDPQMGPETKSKMTALLAQHNPEEQQKVMEEIKKFPEQFGPACAPTLQ